MYLVQAIATDISGCNIHKDTKFIAPGAFASCEGLTEIVIPDNVVIIGEKAFQDCSGLVELTIGDSVETLEAYAFNGCKALDKVVFGKSLSYVGEHALHTIKHSILTTVWYPGEVYISDIAMWSSIVFANVDDNPLRWGARFFLNGELLTEVEIPSGVTEIGNGFYAYDALTRVVIPGSVTKIGNEAFSGCDGLVNVVISEGVISIGDYAFYSCDNLAEITIPNSLESTGESAFEGCKKMTKVHIESIEAWCTTNFSDYYGNPLYAETELLLNGQLVTELVLPVGMTEIGSHIFDGYGKLTKVVFPEGITSIGAGAFLGCTGLAEITIPTSVTAIGDSAFSGCTNLQTITFEGTLEQWYAVSLGTSWTASVPTKKIICSDGEANL